jgi:hypothetical protein
MDDWMENGCRKMVMAERGEYEVNKACRTSIIPIADLHLRGVGLALAMAVSQPEQSWLGGAVPAFFSVKGPLSPNSAHQRGSHVNAGVALIGLATVGNHC